MKNNKKSISQTHKELIKEWDYEKNNKLGLDPKKITYGSGKKAWWKCKKGHKWEATINNRTNIFVGGTDCPYCSNKKVCIDNCLLTKFPKIAKEWHLVKNKQLTPKDVVYGSHKKVWWQCKNGHEWKAVIAERVYRSNCPYCSNKKVCMDNCLLTKFPKIAKEWHPIKNSKLTPKDVAYGSNKKVWWLCKKGHSWESRVSDRVSGNNCPYCSNRKVCIDNCLLTKFPKIAKEWHPTKNGKLTPKDVTTGSGKKAWWLCEKGHEWQTKVINRTTGSDCHYCCGQKVCKDNCLATVNPILSKEWHSIKNGKLTPNDVTSGNNTKVWWLCKKGHEWKATIYSRNCGNGCPYCSGKKACKDNCLKTKYPTLSKEWDYKSNKLTPEDVTFKSAKNIWWICSKNKNHKWQDSVHHRTGGRNCPFCSGKRVSDDNCLAVVNSILSKEWHPTKNGKLTPNDVTTGTAKRAWWLCERGHEWNASIGSRVAGNGCPFCHKKSEAKVKELLLKYFENWDIISNKKIWNKYKNYDHKRFCDFWMEKKDVKVMIEYDGEQHFRPVGFGCKDKVKVMDSFRRTQKKDKLDTQFCKENNIILHRIKYDEDKEESIRELQLSIKYVL